MAKHVEPIVADWRTGVQIPPAPPNKHLKTSSDVFFCALNPANTRLSGLLASTEVHHQPRFEARELIATGKDPKEHREAELQLCAVPPMPFAYVLVFKKAVWLD